MLYQTWLVQNRCRKARSLEVRGVLAVPEAISTLPPFLPFPSSRELRLTTVNVETSAAMAAAKGDLKVVCEGVTRNLGPTDWEKMRLMMLF